jgi:hypothetical protein
MWSRGSFDQIPVFPCVSSSKIANPESTSCLAGVPWHEDLKFGFGMMLCKICASVVKFSLDFVLCQSIQKGGAPVSSVVTVCVQVM